MARFLTLSMAARLVGIKRGALQKKIQAGELATFEGMLELDELIRVYPNVEVEDSTMIEKVNQFAENAVRKIATSALPNAEVLLVRVGVLSQELAVARAEMLRYASLLDQLKLQIASLDGSLTDEAENSVRMFKSWFLAALEGKPAENKLPERLLAREAFLRVMAAHVRLTPSGHDYFIEGSDNVLEAGLHSGLSLPFGCNDASCGQCKMKVLSGQVDCARTAVFNLDESEQRDGYILACCCSAVTDLLVEVDEAFAADDIPEQKITPEVCSVHMKNGIAVVRARLVDGQRLRFLAGQYVHVQFADGSSSDCAVANCPCDEYNLEFHLSSLSNETFHKYALADLEPGQRLLIRGPKGNFVLDTDSPRPLIFIAFDIGFAAIKSLIEHALALNSTDSIHLYRVSTDDHAAYLENQCRCWADALDEFTYTEVADSGSLPDSTAVVDQILHDYQHLAHFDIYISAPKTLIKDLGLMLEKRGGAINDRVFIEPIRFS